MDGSDLQLREVGAVFGFSDHASFNRIKVPVLHFYTGMHQDVHKTTDTADKINSLGAVKVLSVARKVIEQVATDPNRMVFSGGAMPATTSAPIAVALRNRPYLGVAVESAGEGCKIIQVLAESPAQAAGLQVGDVIVRWNNWPVKENKDLFSYLNKSQPEEEVQLKVRRGDKVVNIKVKLGRH